MTGGGYSATRSSDSSTRIRLSLRSSRFCERGRPATLHQYNPVLGGKLHVAITTGVRSRSSGSSYDVKGANAMASFVRLPFVRQRVHCVTSHGNRLSNVVVQHQVGHLVYSPRGAVAGAEQILFGHRPWLQAAGDFSCAGTGSGWGGRREGGR